MSDMLDLSRLLTLRKITRCVADMFLQDLKTHLATLYPLFHPRTVFGQTLRGGDRVVVKGEDDAFEELKRLYLNLASKGPFNLPKRLDAPLDILLSPPELFPVEQVHVVRTVGESKSILVSSPLKWVLAFSGFGPMRLRDLLANQKSAVGNELQHCVLEFLVMHVTLRRHAAVLRLLESLRFQVVMGQSVEFGELPICYVTCPISTVRPTDDIIMQSTEISGMPAFEEIIRIDDFTEMRDPLRDRVERAVAAFDHSLAKIDSR